MYQNETERTREVHSRFLRCTADHDVSVIHDDGLFRHLRIANPASSEWSYELTTVPGSLIYRSGETTFVFSRDEDMFRFFRSENGVINPDYWFQKITDGPGRAKRYDADTFRAVVLERFFEDVRDEALPTEHAGPAFTRLCQDVLADHIIDDESLARDSLAAYRYDLPGSRPYEFADTYEWDFWHWDSWYLWACYAIVHGIGLYDAAKDKAAVHKVQDALARVVPPQAGVSPSSSWNEEATTESPAEGEAATVKPDSTVTYIVDAPISLGGPAEVTFPAVPKAGV